MNKQTIEIKDYIGVFDNFIDPKTCDKLIKWYEQKESFNEVFTRIQSEDIAQDLKEDTATDIREDNFYTLWDESTPNDFPIAMNNVFQLYNKRTNIMRYIGLNELHWDNFKIQKTKPSEGYHVWHIEHNPTSRQSISRVLVFTVYLNDMDKGGETEFLLQSQRVAPRKGRICVFPAYFPYVHRGNPPLEKDKYIVTGWLYASRHAK